MKMRPKQRVGLQLTRRERATLEQLLRRGHTGLWIATRAWAVLLAAAGQTVSG